MSKKNLETQFGMRLSIICWSILLSIVCFFIFFFRSYFFSCSKPICVPPGSPKTYFVFNHNSIYHILSKLFDPQDLISHGSHLIFVKSCALLICVVMVKISLNFNKVCFMLYSTTQSIKNGPPQKKPKAVKGGGVEGKYDRVQRFNGF